MRTHGYQPKATAKGKIVPPTGGSGTVKEKPVKKSIKRDYAESRIQAEAVSALSLLGVYVLMIPNGEIAGMTARKYRRLVALGFRSGAPDTILLERNTARFFGLEFKQPGGRQSVSQKSFQFVCIANNWPYEVVDSVDKAIAQAKDWGLIHA